jgi:hypothetical protein
VTFCFENTIIYLMLMAGEFSCLYVATEELLPHQHEKRKTCHCMALFHQRSMCRITEIPLLMIFGRKHQCHCVCLYGNALLGRPSVQMGRTRLAPCTLASRASHGSTGSSSRLVPHTLPVPRAVHASRLMPPLMSRAARRPRLALRSPALCQLASIGRQQIDEHMLQPYILCILDVCYICFIWMLQK